MTGYQVETVEGSGSVKLPDINQMVSCHVETVVLLT